MTDKVDLRLDWCSYEAAKYAVEHWHYSRRMPKSKLAKIGVWENGEFIGVIVFGVGATSDLVVRFGIDKWSGCELVRIALKEHKTYVTRLISIAIKMIKNEFQGLRLLVSFADPEHNHNGAIYQGANWIYTGMTAASDEYLVNGKRWHGRALRHEKPAHLTTKEAAYLLDPNYKKITGSSKYRYLYPLDDAMRKQIEPLRRPYPKRGLGEIDSAPETNRETGGASLTSPLLLSNTEINTNGKSEPG